MPLKKDEFKELCIRNLGRFDLTPTEETRDYLWTDEYGDWYGYVFFYDRNLTKVEVYMRCGARPHAMMYRKSDGGYAKDRKEYKNTGWTINAWTYRSG